MVIMLINNDNNVSININGNNDTIVISMQDALA